MSFQIQQQIKNNAADIKSYVEDLYSWEEQMDKKEKQKKVSSSSQPSVPVRGKADIEVSDSVTANQSTSKSTDSKSKDPAEKNQQLIRDQNTVGDYYKAWDKFDVDKEIEDLDQKHKHDDQSKMENPYEAMTSTKPRAAPRAQIKINSQRSAIVDINSLKDKANLAYQSLDFKKANELYSECIQLLKDQKTDTSDEKLLFANIYSNRAMTNLKLQEYGQAEIDSTSALHIDPKHVKSYLRRGTARKKLQKIKDAHEDFKTALQIQPDNKEAQKECTLIETALNERKQKAQQGLLLEGKGDDSEYHKLEIPDISGSDIGSDSEDDDEDDEDDEEEAPIQNKFARLSLIDKKVSHNEETQEQNNSNLDRKRSVLFANQDIDLDSDKQYSYHQDEIPEHSILKNSHDLGHLVKNIDSKLIKHEESTGQEEDGSHTVKFKGAEVPTQTFTPRHNLRPRNSILKNSPLVADNFHAEIKDIDGKIVKHHSKFKDEEKDDQEEDHEVHFKKNLAVDASKGEHHHFIDHAHSPKKHILKHNLEDNNEVEQLHNKYFHEKKHDQEEDSEEASYAYTQLKNIDGKASEHKGRSPRHKPQFQKIEDNIADDDDDKKVHFGQVQSLIKTTDVPHKEAKPRHSILKSQGNQNSSVEIQQILKLQEEQKSEDNRIDDAIEQGKQKIKETIIEQAKSAEITSSKFLVEWNNLKNDLPSQFKYLKQVDPHQLVHIFKEGIELPVLNEIFAVLSTQYSKDDSEIIKNYILQIPNLKRFKLSIGLLSAADKKGKIKLREIEINIKETIDKLASDHALKNDDVQKAKDLYKIK